MFERISLRACAGLRDVVKRCFPSYRKHDVMLYVSPRPVSLTPSVWDGGSKPEWFDVTPSGVVTPLYAPLRPRVEGTLTYDVACVGAGHAVVEGGTSCGRTATLCFHVAPDDARAFGLGSRCATCGRPLSPVDVVMSPTCGPCARDAHASLTGGA